MRLNLAILVLAVAPGFAWSQSPLVKKVDQNVPANPGPSDPQGHVLVQVDDTTGVFPPFPADDMTALASLQITTEYYTTGEYKNKTDQQRTEGVNDALNDRAQFPDSRNSVRDRKIG